MHLPSACLPPNQRDMFEKQGYYIESFFLEEKMGLRIRGLNLQCQFSMPTGQINLLILQGRGPQDKEVNYLLFQYDTYRTVPHLLSLQILKYNRTHTFKNNIIALY